MKKYLPIILIAIGIVGLYIVETMDSVQGNGKPLLALLCAIPLLIGVILLLNGNNK
jgi:hypothetical protein